VKPFERLAVRMPANRTGQVDRNAFEHRLKPRCRSRNAQQERA
jgi:hypothetical protein